jgi:hypothetical protein
MIKIKFNVKKLLSAVAVIATMSNAHAQTTGGGGGTGTHTVGVTPPSGRTHCTTVQDDCGLGSKVQVTFTINTGGISPIDPIDEYQVVIKLYRGEWTPAGWAFTVINETTTYAGMSLIISSPADFTTPSFFTTDRIYTVSRNGSYRAQTTLKQNTVSNGWVDRYTTPLSPYYAVNDVTLEPIGDWAEVALVENLNVAPYFNYKINGYAITTPAPTIITCPAVPLTINNIVGAADNLGTSTITVQKGSLIGNAFTTSGSPESVTFATTNANQTLTSLFPAYLGSYAGALKVTYRVPDDVCGGVTTTVAKSMTITVATAAFLNDYKASIPLTTGAVACGATTSKAVSTTWNITTTMPSNTDLNQFRCQLKTAIGWAGANTAGIRDVSFSGPFTVDVYEVNSATGVRLSGAPSIYLNSGTIISGQEDQIDLLFNDPANGAEFDASAPFYVSTNFPANAFGLAGGNGSFFRQHYIWSKANSSLASYSAKVFCVEVSQYPAGGCVVNKKSYFKIANNGYGATANGQNARTAIPDEETDEILEYLPLNVFPNPTKGELIIPVTEDDANVSIRIIDNLGKEVLNLTDVKNGNITIEKLTAGIYFYTIHKNGNVYRGKVVKE